MTERIFDFQFSQGGDGNVPRQSGTVYVVIAKPTRVCNADCAYCSSPPLEEMGESWEPEWNLEKFKKYFDKVYPYMAEGAFWIWHGGEPMLMGHNFYRQAHQYAREQMEKFDKRISFSMQSNLLSYDKKNWYDIFANDFSGSISSSFDADELQRTMKGDAELYSRTFKKRMENILNDGFRPMVIGVYTEETAHLMHKMYDWSLSLGDKGFPLRFNYCHPSGRFEEGGEIIKPITYANALIDVYNRWIKDTPNFTITPLDQMFKKIVNIDGMGHCPWTRKCGGRFIEIEPNGEVYNCSEFADIGTKYCFGSLEDDNTTIQQMLNTKPALQIKKRLIKVPVSCSSCEHFNDCEGGCMRDAMLYKHGLYGKFHYCESWKRVFTRIKQSILTGEADGILRKYDLDVDATKAILKNEIKNHFSYSENEMNELITGGLHSPLGFSKADYNIDFQDPQPFDPEYEKPEIRNANKKLANIKLVVNKD